MMFTWNCKKKCKDTLKAFHEASYLKEFYKNKYYEELGENQAVENLVFMYLDNLITPGARAIVLEPGLYEIIRKVLKASVYEGLTYKSIPLYSK